MITQRKTAYIQVDNQFLQYNKKKNIHLYKINFIMSNIRKWDKTQYMWKLYHDEKS